MNIQTPNQTGSNGQPQTSQPRIPWLLWILLIGLMIWNVITFFKVAPPQLEIPYSTFIDQIKAGNISTVTITANEITGSFLQPVTSSQVATVSAIHKAVQVTLKRGDVDEN